MVLDIQYIEDRIGVVSVAYLGLLIYQGNGKLSFSVYHETNPSIPPELNTGKKENIENDSSR